ncbi:CalpC, partial [Trypoxylus dichotomus]
MNSEWGLLRTIIGDRWLVSCLGVLFLNKGLFYRVVPADQSFTGEQYAGLFRFRLWWCGEWTEVLVDDRLPTVHGRLAFLQCQNSDHFWPGLLEKAYA